MDKLTDSTVNRIKQRFTGIRNHGKGHQRLNISQKTIQSIPLVPGQAVLKEDNAIWTKERKENTVR